MEGGLRAGEQGKAGCPYPAHSREAWSWQSGFVEGIACSVRNLDSPKAEEDPKAEAADMAAADGL